LEHSNHFDDPTKLLSDLYLTKFLDISAKSFRVYIISRKYNYIRVLLL